MATLKSIKAGNDGEHKVSACDETHCEFAYIQELAEQLQENAKDNRTEALAMAIQFMANHAWEKLEKLDEQLKASHG